MQKVCSEVPLQWILTETDSPFLKSPKGWITPISEPACVVEVVKKIAEIKNMSFEKVASATSQNAAKLFGIPR
jgi:TatD DNase family protein